MQGTDPERKAGSTSSACLFGGFLILFLWESFPGSQGLTGLRYVKRKGQRRMSDHIPGCRMCSTTPWPHPIFYSWTGWLQSFDTCCSLLLRPWSFLLWNYPKLHIQVRQRKSGRPGAGLHWSAAGGCAGVWFRFPRRLWQTFQYLRTLPLPLQG